MVPKWKGLLLMRGDRRGIKDNERSWNVGKYHRCSCLDDERGEKVQQVALGKVEMTAAKRQRTLLRRDRFISGYVGGK